MTERFAIYYAPSAQHALWERAAVWLGRDAATGDVYDGPVGGIERSRLLNITQSASRYGFHATLKAPMVLVEGATAADLKASVAAFAASHQPVTLGTLELASLDGFIAIVPRERTDELLDFAAHLVESLEIFRAPLTIRDRDARAAKGLTERQIELLDAYGYPYVFEEFFFHMTLTDRLAEADRAEIMAAAATWFSPLRDASFTLDRISIFHEPQAGAPFMRLADFTLGKSD